MSAAMSSDSAMVSPPSRHSDMASTFRRVDRAACDVAPDKPLRVAPAVAKAKNVHAHKDQEPGCDDQQAQQHGIAGHDCASRRRKR